MPMAFPCRSLWYADGCSSVAQWSQPEIGHEGRSRHLSQRFSQGLRGLIQFSREGHAPAVEWKILLQSCLGVQRVLQNLANGLEGVAELVRLAGLAGDPATFPSQAQAY